MYIILGYGKTGQAVAKFFLKNNIQFLINDSNTNILHANNLEGRILESPPHNSVGIKAIICSPGISTQYLPTNDFIIFAKNNNIPIISDIQLFYEFFPSKKYIAITGTNGKSTTTTLTYEILKNAGLNVALCGNIGTSPFENAINCDICVLEISSFQLEITHNITFDFSAIINITPDHLDRYPTIQEYSKEKLRIIELSKKCITNQNIHHNFQNTLSFSVTEENTGYFFKNGNIFLNQKILCQFPTTQLLGLHNTENILCAFALCHLFGIEINQICDGISKFKGIQHRLELIHTTKDIKYYNDSKATNLDSTYNALRALSGNIFLIAGGKLVEDITGIFEKKEFQNVKMIALIGSCAGKISKELQEYNNKNTKKIKYFLCGSLEKAVELLTQEAQKVENSSILLSPFCKSFDQFKNFEERGEKFKKYVEALVI
jgi:UDP-N-acetylmuramoylalanine--D-glutamate ligase